MKKGPILRQGDPSAETGSDTGHQPLPGAWPACSPGVWGSCQSVPWSQAWSCRRGLLYSYKGRVLSRTQSQVFSKLIPSSGPLYSALYSHLHWDGSFRSFHFQPQCASSESPPLMTLASLPQPVFILSSYFIFCIALNTSLNYSFSLGSFMIEKIPSI